MDGEDLGDDGQAEPAARLMSVALERFAEPRQVGRVDAGAAVVDGEGHGVLVSVDPNGHPLAVTEAVGQGVADEVAQRADEVAVGNVDERALGGRLDGQRRPELVGPGEQSGDGFFGEAGRAAEGAVGAAGADGGQREEVSAQCRDALDFGLAEGDGLPRRLGDGLVGEQVEVADDRGKRGVDVVGEPGREMTMSLPFTMRPRA